MSKRNFIFYGIISCFLIISCQKEESLTSQEMLEGKWIINSSELLGSVVPGDGSYLVFNACVDSVCSGVDYKASDSSTGAFTYLLNGDATSLQIVDTTSDGGSYNGTWDILELTNTDFRIIAETGLFGTFKMEMTKE